MHTYTYIHIYIYIYIYLIYKFFYLYLKWLKKSLKIHEHTFSFLKLLQLSRNVETTLENNKMYII